jgi:two-component system chemotaxis response regulator CheB
MTEPPPVAEDHGTLPPRGVVVIGASAGGVQAVTEAAASLPADLPFAVLVALHMPASVPSVLAKILDRCGPLPAHTAAHGDILREGRIYVAIPDHHLLVLNHHTALSEGPTENGFRPAINALFRSAALAYGPRAVGVLMSGVLDDGVLGLAAIRARGGITVAQDPADALFAAMPVNALAAGVVDEQVEAGGLGRLLLKLAEREFEEKVMDPDPKMELENKIAMGPRFSTTFDSELLGPPSGYICPDCNGSLMLVSETSYRCRVGHAWSPDALLRARDVEIEGALWVALRSLQEKSRLSRKLAANVGQGPLFERYTALAEEAEHAVKVLGERLTAAYSDSEAEDVG